MLPRPYAGALFGLSDGAVLGNVCVYKLNVAIVGLGLFIKQLKYTLRARHSHNHCVELLADLYHRLREALVQRKERDQRTEGKSGHVGAEHQRKHRAYCNAEHVADISEVRADRHEDIRKLVRIVCGNAELIVELSEALHVLLLVVEYLYYLLTFHHFLDVAVYDTEILLLCAEVLCGLAAYLACCKHHYQHHNNGENGQRNAQHYHADKCDYQRYERVHHLRNALADKLAEGVHVVGVYGHDIAVSVCVEILYREGFHVRENVVSEVAHGTLGNVDHQPVISEGAYNTHNVYQRDTHQRPEQRSEIRSAAGVYHIQHRRDVIVDEALHEQHSHQGGYSRDEYAYENQYKAELIALHHIAEHSAQHLEIHILAIYRSRLTPVSHCHMFPPPYSLGLSKSPPDWVWSV